MNFLAYPIQYQEFPRSLPVWWFARINQGTQHILIFMAMTYYSKWIKNKINKEKRHTGKSLRKPDTIFKSLLSKAIGNVLSSSSNRTIKPSLKCYPQGKLTGAVGSKVGRRGQSQRKYLPSMYPNNSGPLEGKQVFRINHSVCTNIFRQRSHCYWFWEWWDDSWNPNYHKPAKGQPCKQAFQRSAASGLWVLFCMMINYRKQFVKGLEN